MLLGRFLLPGMLKTMFIHFVLFLLLGLLIKWSLIMIRKNVAEPIEDEVEEDEWESFIKVIEYFLVDDEELDQNITYILEPLDESLYPYKIFIDKHGMIDYTKFPIYEICIEQLSAYDTLRARKTHEELITQRLTPREYCISQQKLHFSASYLENRIQRLDKTHDTDPTKYLPREAGRIEKKDFDAYRLCMKIQRWVKKHGESDEQLEIGQ